MYRIRLRLCKLGICGCCHEPSVPSMRCKSAIPLLKQCGPQGTFEKPWNVRTLIHGKRNDSLRPFYKSQNPSLHVRSAKNRRLVNDSKRKQYGTSAMAIGRNICTRVFCHPIPRNWHLEGRKLSPKRVSVSGVLVPRSQNEDSYLTLRSARLKLKCWI